RTDHAGGDAECEPRLAAATDAGKRHESPVVLEHQVAQFGYILIATDELSAVERQVVVPIPDLGQTRHRGGPAGQGTTARAARNSEDACWVRQGFGAGVGFEPSATACSCEEKRLGAGATVECVRIFERRRRLRQPGHSVTGRLQSLPDIRRVRTSKSSATRGKGGRPMSGRATDGLDSPRLVFPEPLVAREAMLR